MNYIIYIIIYYLIHDKANEYYKLIISCLFYYSLRLSMLLTFLTPILSTCRKPAYWGARTHVLLQ